MKARFFLFAWLFFAAFPALASDDILARLSALPGVNAEETTTEEDKAQGLHRFLLHIEQPVDHFAPGRGTFQQKLVLFHRGFQEPMLLQTSGYSLSKQKLSNLATAFATNQLQVEHRYFADSVPAPADWSELTVRQSAEDFHHILQVFKALYPAHWVNTGNSKGGMTSIFHRRFFPGDLDGTVANVAPISFSLEDPRYPDFVANVGGGNYASCRQQLEDFQVQILHKKPEILAKIEGDFHLVDKELSLETSVAELPFIFWQYGNPEDAETGCGKIPEPGAGVDELWKFLQSVNDPRGYDDAGVKSFAPYIYQVGNELGQPAIKLSHLDGLLAHSMGIEPFLPAGEHPTYSNATMRDVSGWVAQQAQGMMFVYGEYDPWTAGAFRNFPEEVAADNHFYLIAKGNHGSNWTQLPDAAKAEASAVLARWFGKAPVKSPLLRAAFFSAAEESLEEAEFKTQRHQRRW